jgi:gentisate 1,2-dioxygenase
MLAGKERAQVRSCAVAYRELRPLVVEAVVMAKAEEAGQRAVMLVIPGRREHSAAVGPAGHRFADIGLEEPLAARRHTAAVLRFSHGGPGAWSSVDRHMLRIGPGEYFFEIHCEMCR